MFVERDKDTPEESLKSIEDNRRDLVERINKVIEKHNWKPLKFLKPEDTPEPPKRSV